MYRYELSETIDAVNLDDWNLVASQDRNPFVDPGFIRAYELSLGGPEKQWYALLYDAQDHPVACACFSLFDVDGTLLAPRWIQRFAGGVRKVLSRFMKFRMLLCGLPPSVSDSNLATVPEIDWDVLSETLAGICERLAKQTQALLISLKEFSPQVAVKLSRLNDLGYHRGDSVRTYILDEPCNTFAEYYDSRSKRTRANMRKYFRQLEAANITWETRWGKDGVAELYTDEVHQLYEAVYDRAEVKFEHLPPEFFREFACQCPETSRFTLFRNGDTIVGFCVALVSSQRYDLVYCGFDYELNEGTSLYFNVLYRGVEDGYDCARREIHIGASADEFKSRMGCRNEILSVYVKGVGRIAGSLFRRIAPLMFPALERTEDA